jgi:hypothetical protein
MNARATGIFRLRGPGSLFCYSSEGDWRTKTEKVDDVLSYLLTKYVGFVKNRFSAVIVNNYIHCLSPFDFYGVNYRFF